MAKMTNIYRLVDPRDGQTRYIGKADDLEKRLKQHMATCHRRHYSKKRSEVREWLYELRQQGMEPDIEPVERCPHDDFRERETYWIARHLMDGCDLLNGQNNASGLTLYLSDEAWGHVVSLAHERGVSESEAATNLIMQGVNCQHQ